MNIIVEPVGVREFLDCIEYVVGLMTHIVTGFAHARQNIKNESSNFLRMTRVFATAIEEGNE